MNAQLTNGTVYWIQDISTGQFLSQGDNWSTRAVTKDVGGLGFEATYISDGVYTLKNIMWNTVKSQSRGLGSDLYVDNGTPAQFTLTASGDGYKVSLNGNYWVNNGGENAYKEKPLGTTTDAAAASVWKFLTKTEYDAAIQAYKDGKAAAYAAALGYSVSTVSELEALISDAEEFMSKDYTSSIKNPTLGSNGDNWTHGTVSQRAEGWNVGNGCAEFWNGCGYCKQTVSGLPNGLYKVTFVGSYRPANKAEALNLVSEKTSSPAFVYANDAKVEFLHWIDVPAQGNGRGDITVANGYQNSLYTYVTDGTLTLGIVADGFTDVPSWTTFGQFTLTQYYSVASYKLAYNEAMTAATTASETLDGFTLYATQKSTLDGIITANTLTGDDLSDIDKLTEATINLNNAVLAVATEVAKCQEYNSIVSTIGGGTNIDLTSFIVNPSFESGLTGWTNTGGMVTQGNTSFGKTGNTYAEFWQPNGTKGLSQTIGLLPSGCYELTVDMKARGVSSAKVFAGSVETAVKIADEQNTYVVEFAVDDKVDVNIGFEGVGTGAGSSWLALDNFTLKYVGGLPDVEAVTGKMNADVASAQTEAVAAYEASRTAANFNAAVAAIAAAQASKDAYVAAASAIEKANALKEAHNFASSAAITTFAEAIDAISDAYDDNSLTTDAANVAGTTLGVALSGWRGNPNGAAVKYLNDGFSITDYIDNALYVNTWSTEGENDGSNFKAPFYEYWTGDGSSLAEHTWTGTLTGLPNGLYSVSALVRVRAKNEIAATAATGITMNVNGDGEGEYAAVDVTEGEQIGESQFQYATYTAKGLVKDGNLTLNFNVADGNNVSWLCFKNVKYTKVRDLTPEEAAIVPTAIALKVGDDEVTEPIALNATNNTVTLTVDYTPVDATEGVTWVSSDETVATVANGVVTGVTPGTATITATSTLDEDVKASAIVTVTYPESTVPVSHEVVDGFTKYIYTLGENIIKNGSFEYANNFYGWTTGSGAAMSADNFNLITEDDNHYITAKGHTGAGGANSIGTGWAIEAGKTYVFGYKVKSTSAGNSEFHVVSLTNTLGTETTKVSKTETAVGTDWTDVAYTFTNPATDGYAYVQFRARWLNSAVSFDNFYLAEADVEEIDLRADAEDYTALSTAIGNAEAKTLGFDEGEYAPFNNIEAVNLLAAAKAINQEADNLATDVQAATTALNNATWTANAEELNAVYDGTFAAAENNGAPAGWTMSNNTLGGDYHSRAFVGDDRVAEFNNTNSAFFLRFDGTNSSRGSMYYYGNTEGYTMPLDADTYYRVTVDFAGWGSTGKPLRLNVTGPQGFEAVGQQYNTSVRADNADNTPQKFNIFFKTAGAGNYVINFQTPGADSNTHNVVISNVVLKKALENITIDEDETFEVASTTRYANVTFNRTLVEGWNGLVLPFDMTVEDVAGTFSAEKVKNFTGITYVEGNGVTLNFADFAAETVIPAGKPFLVKVGENPSASYEFNGVLLPTTGLQNITWTADGNDNIQYTMKGTYAASTDLTDVNFALINGNSFYYHTAGKNSSSAKAFRAYFENESTNPEGARVSFDFGDGETTGITELAQPKTAADGTYYDLQGRKVENFKQKGIYILNGRKVVK